MPSGCSPQPQACLAHRGPHEFFRIDQVAVVVVPDVERRDIWANFTHRAGPSTLTERTYYAAVVYDMATKDATVVRVGIEKRQPIEAVLEWTRDHRKDGAAR